MYRFKEISGQYYVSTFNIIYKIIIYFQKVQLKIFVIFIQLKEYKFVRIWLLEVFIQAQIFMIGIVYQNRWVSNWQKVVGGQINIILCIILALLILNNLKRKLKNNKDNCKKNKIKIILFKKLRENLLNHKDSCQKQ